MNYEVWQWPIFPAEVSQKFEECARTYGDICVNEVSGLALTERERAGTALAAS